MSKHIDISEDAIEEIYKFSGGIPFYVQFLGKILKHHKKTDLNQIKKIQEDFLKEEGNILFREEFDYLSPKEKQIVLAIAKGNNSPSKINQATENKISNINSFLTYLEEKGYVLKEEKGYYAIADPVFRRWLEGK